MEGLFFIVFSIGYGVEHGIFVSTRFFWNCSFSAVEETCVGGDALLFLPFAIINVTNCRA
ncbi:hypothetical protein DHD05_05790 [Arenibacter sp. N53]|nr:hypothetical protein [Arenibacter sp. N53]